ncbi:hypothetical protein FB446DRAFT_792416 [Lentinula raphanica]|nr:hypothetical protein FB446DRAFT_792416 [Lentinula raphanica]
MSLPNELLHSIIEYIAYTPIQPHSMRGLPSKTLFKCASTELLTLSVTDWRLRRVCLPFLFAHIKIRHKADTKKLNNEGEGKEFLALFTRFTKVLVISGSATQKHSRTERDDTIVQILPRLKRLFQIEVQGVHCRTDLLRTILAHPTATSVLLHELPGSDILTHKYHDLSKVIIHHEKLSSIPTFCPHFEECLNRGMRLANLEICHPEKLGTQFRTVPGLEKLHLYMPFHPVSFSWMSNLASTCPLLEIWLIDMGTHYFSHHTPPFISSLVEDSLTQNLKDLLKITRIGLRRRQSSQEWHVIGIAFITKTAKPKSKVTALEILL